MTEFLEDRVPVLDGLNLQRRHYRGGTKTPALCLHGLTRNVRDFEDIAPKIAATGRDVHVLSFRGRAASDIDPDFTRYHPLTYRGDVLAALDHLEIARAHFVGTSLGGIVTMLTNQTNPERVASAIINDVGPELAPEGLARIGGYVGGDKSAAKAKDLDEAAERIRAINEPAFPDMDQEFWRIFARRTFRQEKDGWTLDYDPNIALGLAEGPPMPDLWPGFKSLADKPTLLIRGAISDLLTPPIVKKMRAVHPDFIYCEVDKVGHAPTLSEPQTQDAINAFLGQLD